MSPAQKRFNIPSPSSEWKRQLIQDFPSEKEAIIKFFKMADKITTFNGVLPLLAIKVFPLWLVKTCDRLGLIRFFSPFFAGNKKETLGQVVEVKILHKFLNRINS